MQNKAKMSVFFAAMAAGAMGGIAREASALCSCMPAVNHRTVSSQDFLFLGASTTGWDAAVVSDDIYGFQTSLQPTAYLDFYGNGTAVWHSICRQSFSGGAAVCAPQTTLSTTVVNQPYDSGINLTGVYNVNNSPWDYYYIHAASSAGVRFIGAGIGHQACWA